MLQLECMCKLGPKEKAPHNRLVGQHPPSLISTPQVELLSFHAQCQPRCANTLTPAASASRAYLNRGLLRKQGHSSTCIA